MRTDLAPDALPLLEDGSAANEAQLEIVEAIEPFGPGGVETIRVTLEPGAYALIYNIPGHYVLGMSAPFTVTAPPVEAAPPPLEEAGGGIDEPLGAAEEHGDEGGGGLPTGAWVGLVLMFILAGVLIMGSLPYILPKPPGASGQH